MNRPTIGIPGYRIKEEMFGASVNYLNFINHFGNPRIIMPWEEHVEVDLLILPGGLDVSPMRYGEIPGFSTTSQDVFKEHFFKERLPNYVDNTPIFGICLGAQQLAVHFGCKLTQNLMFHAQSSGRWTKAHEVREAYKPKDRAVHKFEVNGHHHQALTTNNLNENIRPLYLSDSPEDNQLQGFGSIVEAFKIVGKPIWGVQWHPEEWFDGFTVELINNILHPIEETKS